MTITHFNRYDSMDTQTLSSIGECISNLKSLDIKRSGVLSNYLYGLYDGYDYSAIIPTTEAMIDLQSKDPALHLKIILICDTVSKYPRTVEQPH